LDSANDVNHSIHIENTELRLSAIIDDELSTTVEALLFASPVPLTQAHLARIAGCDKRRLAGIVASLNSQYMEWGRSFRVEQYGDCYRFYTLPQFEKTISKLAELPRPAKLSKAALEVLSIVAYRQPVVKAEIERIRGIDSDGVIRTLLERGFIVISGKSDSPGRPLLYSTTQDFLEFFGIPNLAQLPVPEIEEPAGDTIKAITLIRPPEDPTSDPDEALIKDDSEFLDAPE
jgi:segregation and condensation protein B